MTQLRPVARLLPPLAVLCACGSVTAQPVAPDAVPGLVAWYGMHSLEPKLRDKEEVKVWKDGSGHDHDLRSDQAGLPSLFRTQQLDGRPVVRLGKATAFEVNEPFTLDDFTLFMVYRTQFERRALLCDGTDGFSGIVLHAEGRQDKLFASGASAAFNSAGAQATDQFAIRVLGRRDSILHAFVNGADVSTHERSGRSIEVAKLFKLSLTRFVQVDGQGIDLAELAFFDRHLDDAARNAVGAYFSQAYGIGWTAQPSRPLEPEPEQKPPAFDWSRAKIDARLVSSPGLTLDHRPRPIDWDGENTLEPSFRIDEDHPSRLIVTGERKRVRLLAELKLKASIADVRPRVLVLLDGERYLPDEATVRVTGDSEVGFHVEATLETVLELDRGQHLEIIVSRVGAQGDLAVELDGATLRATVAAADPK